MIRYWDEKHRAGHHANTPTSYPQILSSFFSNLKKCRRRFSGGCSILSFCSGFLLHHLQPSPTCEQPLANIFVPTSNQPVALRWWEFAPFKRMEAFGDNLTPIKLPNWPLGKFLPHLLRPFSLVLSDSTGAKFCWCSNSNSGNRPNLISSLPQQASAGSSSAHIPEPLFCYPLLSRTNTNLPIHCPLFFPTQKISPRENVCIFFI